MISVIIPIYNVCEYLEAAIESIINQTYKELEIILVDDGSTDSSVDIIEKYEGIDDRIICIHQENQGLSSARNTGLKEAHGKYVFFFDSDDYLHPQALEILINIMNQSGADVVVGSHCVGVEIDDKWEKNTFCDKNYDIKTGREWIFENVLYSDEKSSVDLCCAWGKIYPKNHLDSFSFPVGRLREDEFTTYKLLYNGKKVAYYKYPLYFYRQRSGSIMAQKSDKNYTDCLDALIGRIQYFKQVDNEMYSISKLKCLMYLFDTIKELYKQRSGRKELYNWFVDKYREIYKNYYKDIKKYFTLKQFVKYWMGYYSNISRWIIFYIIMNGRIMR